MAKAGKGEVRFVAGCFETRVRLQGKARLTVKMPTVPGEDEAGERSQLITQETLRLRRAGHVLSHGAQELLKALGAAKNKIELRDCLQVIGELCGTAPSKLSTSNAPTFGAVADEWTSGEMFQRFPDQIKKSGRDFLETKRRQLAKSCFDALRDKPIDEVTRQDCDEVMRQLPLPPGRAELQPATRRQYAMLMTRVLSLAELSGYIDRSPLPRGWTPKNGPRKRFPILYPAEDRALLGCVAVPFEWRLFYGYLHREGNRRGEAAAMTFSEIDLDHAVVTLDENKTDHARWWKLSPGVAATLRWWRDQRGAQASDLLFVDENGGPLPLQDMADRVRSHLCSAGLDRADLFSTGPNKRPFGTHSFRRSMATRNLALGRSEDYVRQRTGHTTDELYRYRLAARALDELDLGDVDPLVLALPETSPLEAIGRGLGRLSERSHCPTIAPAIVGAAGFEPATPRPPAATSDAESTQAREIPEISSSEITPLRTSVGQSWGNEDPVEAALSDALNRASEAGQWATVEVLARELEARRKDRAAPAVVDLQAERRRRGR